MKDQPSWAGLFFNGGEMNKPFNTDESDEKKDVGTSEETSESPELDIPGYGWGV